MQIAAVILSLVVFCIAIWIVLPAPTQLLLAFTVGAPEVSQWLALGALSAIALLAHAAVSSRLARLALTLALVALGLALSVWIRIPAAARRFDAQMQGMSAAPAAPRRRAHILARDLFRPIPVTATAVDDVTIRDTSAVISLDARVYRPAARGPHPIVVQIYGGAWQGGRPADNGTFATWLANAGYVVFAISYRHAPRWRWPAQIEDVYRWLDWIATHGADWDGDSSRVVLLGRSAGAHLAMMAAWRGAPMSVRGVVSLYGPADLVEPYRHPPVPDPLRIRDIEAALLGAPFADMPDRYADASPISRVRAAEVGLTPALLIYGARDHIAEAKHGRALAAALRARGTRVAYLEIPWADHAFDAVFNGPSSQLSLYYSERFVAWAVGRDAERSRSFTDVERL